MGHHMKPGDHPLVAQVCRVAFPDYRGQKCEVEYTNGPLDLRSCWGGGSRTYWVLLRLADMGTLPIPAQSAFDAPIAGAEAYMLPPGVVAVAHVIFSGHDLGFLRVYARPDGVKLLPAAELELTADEKLVLAAHKGLKSSYGGVSDYRKHSLCQPRYWSSDPSPRMTPARVDAARVSLKAKGLLNAAGAITNAGRNAAEGLPRVN